MSVYSLIWIVPLTLIIAGAVFLSIGRTRKLGTLCLNILMFIIMAGITLFIAMFISFTAARQNLYILLLAGVMLMLFVRLTLSLWDVPCGKKVRLSMLGSVAVCGLVVVGTLGYDAYVRSVLQVDTGEDDNLISSYAPFSVDGKVAVLPEPATLALDGELPRLDGATALFPIYSAFARAVYPHYELTAIQHFEKPGINLKDLLLCTTTPNAYQRLIDGEADMIFVASASKGQQETAAEKGIELTFTPIGKEAFIFFVNARNPISSLTLEQIQGIYGGEITSWSSLGAPSLGDVKAFQRPDGSGSQTTLQKLMEGRTLVTAPEENVVSGMGGIISQTADYRNFSNAIGYSFRFYATEMVTNNQVKLLSVNGVEPTKETIRDGSYPIASEFYAVTTQNSNPACAQLLEWILSPQGQWLIEQTGYVGVG